MSRDAWVVLTALPPTVGHEALIRFAAELAHQDGGSTFVVLCSQPDEPWILERYMAIADLAESMSDENPLKHRRVSVLHHTDPIQQEPDGDDPAFWRMWGDILRRFGAREGSYMVGSELYGVRFAQEVGMQFMPYDIARDVVRAKATLLRRSLSKGTLGFGLLMPTFQKYLQFRVTVFGAESTGKTTLSRVLADDLGGRWLPEWARPYLETVGPEITDESMDAIWHGQAALQRIAPEAPAKQGIVVQDTDLFSTVGYWDYMLPSDTPEGLIRDAHDLKSDLYIVTKSNIPFEEDPIRYGGDRRETEDHHWTDLLDKHGLNYVVLESNNLADRRVEAGNLIREAWRKHTNLDYVRQGKEYAT